LISLPIVLNTLSASNNGNGNSISGLSPEIDVSNQTVNA
jgi:hypothetical protein